MNVLSVIPPFTIELSPDFSPRHVANVRALARAHYWDGTAIVRVQDDYVAQWGWSDSTAHPHGDAVDAHEQRISLQRVGRRVARGHGCVD